ncbi:MAG: carbohydrate kinase family protein [Ignavibacterium sp.]|uniref:carbohydrate kinase family protein n=1 Tax=Ignavibacterium sp. TaxID=2651167 RepID=UPI004049A21F
MNKKFDVIVVGELNVDLILNEIDSFPEIGKEKISQRMNLTLGSSSAIFASNLSSLGAKVSFLGMIGKDLFGTLVKESLSKKNVDTKFLIESDKWNTGATIVLNFDEDRAMVTYPGAMEHLKIDDIPDEVFTLAKHLHFSSYFLQTGIQKDIDKLFKKAKDFGLTTSLDIQWDPKELWNFDYAKVLPYVDIFFPNEQEILKLTKENTVENALTKLIPHSNIIVVKLGRKGSLLVKDGNASFRESFLNNNVVDAIGAGDSFNAGFIFKFINNAALNECQEFGNLMGAINTTAAGGTTAFTDFNQIMKIAKEKFNYNNEIN